MESGYKLGYICRQNCGGVIMITTENVTIGNRQFKKTVSDTYLIRKVGTDEIYSEAYDLPEKDYEYEETDELLPKNDLM